MTHRFRISADFSPTVGSRFRNQGPNSGEEFRSILRDRLSDAITDREFLEVDLDGSCGYPASFLSEGFAVLAREMGGAMSRWMVLKSDEEPYLIDEVWAMVRKAEAGVVT